VHFGTLIPGRCFPLRFVCVHAGFAGFFIWLVSPFVTRRKSFHAVVVLKRVLVILVSCQVLRILTFLSTQIPAPAPHCRAPEPTSNVPWPVVSGAAAACAATASGCTRGWRCGGVAPLQPCWRWFMPLLSPLAAGIGGCVGLLGVGGSTSSTP